MSADSSAGEGGAASTSPVQPQSVCSDIPQYDPNGYCNWAFDGTNWILLQNCCNSGYKSNPPTSSGFQGEVVKTQCVPS